MKIKKAFSLIELSIVILIIGILIAGVIQASNLLSKFRISSANTLTESSPVNGIYGLVLWLETTKKESFDDSVDPSGSANTVENWYNINPQSYKTVATQSSAGSRAILVDKSPLNYLPALKFNGTSNFYTMSPVLTSSNPNLTIFAVGVSLQASIRNAIFGQYSLATQDTNHFFRIAINGGIDYDEFMPTGGRAHAADGSVVSNVPFILTVVRSTNIPKIYKNGELLTTGAAEIYSGAAIVSTEIGRRGGTNIADYFNGYLGEIIVFDKALKSEERSSIESYLSKKWAIKLK